MKDIRDNRCNCILASMVHKRVEAGSEYVPQLYLLLETNEFKFHRRFPELHDC
jgi:hypothetical protein